MVVLQLIHVFFREVDNWNECLRHVVDEELGKVLQAIDILKWLSQAFNHPVDFDAYKNSTRRKAAINSSGMPTPQQLPVQPTQKKNITKQSQLKPTIETRKLEDKLRKDTVFFLGKLMPMTTCQETLAPRNIEHHATGRQQPEVIWELGFHVSSFRNKDMICTLIKSNKKCLT